MLREKGQPTIREDVVIKEKLDFHKESESAQVKREISQTEVNRQYWLGKEIYELVQSNLDLSITEQIKWIGHNCEYYTKRCIALNRKEIRDYAAKVRDSKWYGKNPQVCERRIAGKKIENDRLITRTYQRFISKKIMGLVMMLVGEEKDMKLRKRIMYDLKVAQVAMDNQRELQALSVMKMTAIRLMKF